MKKIMLMISMIILLCSCGTNKEELKEKKGITSVTCEKALDLQADQGVIIDVREKDEYDESHLEGAINIPYTEIVNKIEDVVDDKDSIIIVYCKSGKRSFEAGKLLKKEGYKNTYNLGSMSNCYKK